MSAPSSRDELRADQRRRLLDAMATILQRDGFHGARIQDIAREAKVSLRTFYAEFETKEQCFLALHRELVSQMTGIVRESLDFSKPWKDVMRQGFQVYYGALAAYPLFTRAISLELATLSEEARQQRDETLEDFANLLIELVERGRELHPDIPSQSLSVLMARGLTGAVTELVDRAVVRDEIDQLPEVVDTTTEMLWRMVTHVEPANAASAPKAGGSGVEPAADGDVRR
ncbi:MAG: TetR/AcrR family transcriptional regulator [Solirubrobacteraceae bacterium]|nr:TetR/AcrR family transcriptional regulator [Solirubrobacteraceae bacterium]